MQPMITCLAQKERGARQAPRFVLGPVSSDGQ